MTPRSLFIIILKVIGLLVLVDILKLLPSFVEAMPYIFHGEDTSRIIAWLWPGLGVAVVYYITLKYLLLKPTYIIEKLNLDKDFEEETFELNIHRSTAIKIGIVFVGGCIFVQNFVPFLTNLYTFIKLHSSDEDPDPFAYKRVGYMDLAYGAMMCLVAYYFVSNSQYLTNFIEGVRRKKDVPVEESADEEGTNKDEEKNADSAEQTD